jgi:butyryl-CoA dehydrogenase
MTGRLLSRDDIDFLLDWLGVGDLLDRPRYQHLDTEAVRDVLDLSADLAQSHFATHNSLSDRSEPRFADGRVELIGEVKQALDAFAESGLIAAARTEDLGGGQLPAVVHRACFAWFQAANIATASYPMLTMANAALLAEFGTPDQIDLYLRPMLTGRFSGTMCLSETQAGSSLADVATQAEPDGPARYRLFGTKMWISAGDHELTENIIHLVLARTRKAEVGTAGLSLFIVQRRLVSGDGSLSERNDVSLVGINHKMGYRGTVNTVLAFGDGAHTPSGRPGAVGYLVGAEGDGLKQMFHMMNEARIAVGTGAAALACTSYLHALEYARARPQGRPRGVRGGPQVPIIRHADVGRMLMCAKSYAEGGMAMALYAARLVDEQHSGPAPAARAHAARLLDVLTPIVKSWPSQWGLSACDLAIQIHGGYGYTRDYPVEQFYRDNRLNSIHEGTFGIQAIDLLGRKLRGDGLDVLTSTIRATVSRAAGSDQAGLAAQLSRVLDRWEAVVRGLLANKDADAVLAGAAVHLEAAGHVVAAWMWLEQALAAERRSDRIGAAKQATARFFFTWELPRVWPQLELLASNDRLLADLDEDWF